MTIAASLSMALLAVAVPHVSPALLTAGAAPAAQTAGPTQRLERLKFRGVSSPSQVPDTAQAQAAAPDRISPVWQNRPGHRAADVRPAMRLRGFAANAAAPVPVPTPAGQTVVGAGANFSGFSGLTHRDQKLAGTGVYVHSQFSLEPPDQGLCVGNGYVMEAVNNALGVYSSTGKRLSSPTALSEFFHLAPEFNPNAQPTTYGPLLSDPRCYFDADTQRWFVTELEADRGLLSGGLTGSTAIFVAVSQTANPLGAYSLYAIDTTDAGKGGKPGCPCLPDQPLLGEDANGIYISTNEFPFPLGSGFNGAQIYALSKRALANGQLPTIVHFDAGAIPTPDAGGQWYSVQPASSPTSSQYNYSHNGTEFFLSALQFGPAPTDNRIAVWALTNTRSLDAMSPNLKLQHVVIASTAYANPPAPAVQKPGPTPLGKLLGETEEKVDTGDDRMNQVVYSGGRLWSAVNTAVRFASQQTTGIAYFVVSPQLAASGSLGAQQTAGGYVAVRGQNLIYPSIGVNARGNPLMTFTLVGPNYFPSAAYVTETGGRVSNVMLAAAGAAPDDGFTGYAYFGSTDHTARWGDYSAAVADRDGSLWFATEYIPSAPRTQLANWGTFIGHVQIP